jgi:hypothetical protein
LRRAALALAFGVAACGATHVAPPRAASPELSGPAAAIPGDLDVVVRVDLGRMRNALGPDALSGFKHKTPGDSLRAAGDARLYDAAFREADTVWVAFRPGESVDLTDNVVVMKGHFADIDPQGYPCLPRWGAARDLGAAWRLYERSTPTLRSAAARIYARADDLLVFVSGAEIDSAQRVIEQHADDARVEPEEKGAVSVAARTRALVDAVRERAPAAARLLEQAKRLRADADFGGGDLKAELELDFSEDAEARKAADAAGLLAKSVEQQGGALGQVARALDIEAVGTVLVVRLKLAREVLGPLVACADGKGAC